MADLGPEFFSEQELTCSICLDLFTKPVSTPCGHNFCQSCIGGYWASSVECTCPLCKRPFDGRPELSINLVFAHIADKYKEMRYGGPPPIKPRKNIPAATTTAAATAAAEAAAGGGGLVLQNGSSTSDIPCDVCTGRKERAVSSCLTCIASYCETHVQPHCQNPFYASHRLLDPREALQGRTCHLHGRLLEVFCRTDQRCICAICVLEEHRTHATVSVQTERAVKQRMLGKTELDIQRSIERRALRAKELKQRLQFLRNYAQAELSEVEQVLYDVTQSVERIHRELVGGIEDKRDSVIGQGERIVSQLEAEMGKLQERRAQLEVQATSEDHIRFLQSFEEVNAPYQDTMTLNNDPDLELHFSFGEVKNTLSEIRERLDDIHMGEVQYRHSVTSLPETESMLSIRSNKKRDFSLKDLRKLKSGSSLKKVRGYTEDVTLNPVTAYPFLILSEDRKQLKRGEKLQFFRNSTQRFDVWSCITAKEGYDTGRHYWEVSVGDNKDWKVGVVRDSAQRKGLFDMSPSNGYYVLWWSTNHLQALTGPPLVKVKMNGRLRYLGVYLDCEEGQVTFYNAKTGSEIYSFTAEGAFSEKMFPLFGTSDKEIPLMLPGGPTHTPE
ncbi:E3 ubiquitin-protein ligase TRIM7 [Clarias gariepinus]|uniref:E3 ubiquitin-protein ligase TRIM7 n=1 Tax=Clarias gariepinus TaxID=13013 RepID=UPI00234D8EE4|nr:E3 ubiquitin-protein ligase TRIM7 [Clarias gariepinus]